MDGDVSRGVGNSPVSPHSSPDFAIVDEITSKTFGYFFVYFATKSSRPTQSGDWMIDSGCTNHMFFDEEQFIEYQVYRAGIIIANGVTVWIKGRGTVVMEWLLPDGVSNVIDVKDVLHVPDLACGLFSISQAMRKGFEITFIDDDCHILRNGNLLGNAPKVNNIYILSVLESTANVAVIIQ